MSNMPHPVVISALSQEDGGGYIAYSPDLPGCLADGETPEEALTAFRDALNEWADEMRANNLEIPAPWASAEGSAKRGAALKRLVGMQQEVIAKQDALIQRLSQLTTDMLREIEKGSALDARWSQSCITQTAVAHPVH